MAKREKKITPQGLEVFVNSTGNPKKDSDSLDYALRELKKKVKKSGLMQELRRREYYMSPSKYNRFKSNEALKRSKREERKNEKINKNKNKI